VTGRPLQDPDWYVPKTQAEVKDAASMAAAEQLVLIDAARSRMPSALIACTFLVCVTAILIAVIVSR
jgi:hypothetical protein